MGRFINHRKHKQNNMDKDQDESSNSTSIRLNRISSYTSAEKIWKNHETHLKDLFERHKPGIVIKEIKSVMDHALWKKLMAAKQRSGGQVQMSFHGTDKRNIDKIIKTGFMVPGQGGVRVENGSVHGVGIYSAKTPEISFGYVRSCSQMFVCATVINTRSTPKTTIAGDIIVQFSSDFIIPVFLVKFDHPQFKTMGTQPKKVKKVNIYTVQYKQAKKLEKLRQKLKLQEDREGETTDGSEYEQSETESEDADEQDGSEDMFNDKFTTLSLDILESINQQYPTDTNNEISQ